MEDQRTFLILANPMARRGVDSLIDTIRRAAPVNARFTLHLTEPQRLEPGALKDLARGCEAVIAVGGDGTVAEAATGLDGEQIPIGIVPAGSTNIVGRNLGVPSDPFASMNSRDRWDLPVWHPAQPED